jgi:hypothetical protein
LHAHNFTVLTTGTPASSPYDALRVTLNQLICTAQSLQSLLHSDILHNLLHSGILHNLQNASQLTV